jgi:hypothetical protein
MRSVRKIVCLVLNATRGTLRYRLFSGNLGELFSHLGLAEAFDKGDKGSSKMMKVGLRTFLIEVLHLPTDRADPDLQSNELAKRK